MKLGRNICEHNKDYKEMVSRHYKEISHTLIRQLKHITTFFSILFYIFFHKSLYFNSNSAFIIFKEFCIFVHQFPYIDGNPIQNIWAQVSCSLEALP